MATNNSVNSPLSGTTGTGNFVGATSPTLTTPKINQINDTNNNQILNFSPTASAVNYLQIINNATGGAPVLVAAGADANVNLQFNAQAQGAFSFYTTGTANQLIFNSGASYQHTTNLSFPSSSANRTVTFPDATGTVALSGASQDVTFNSVSWSDTTKGIVGTTTNNNASAGYVGEFISSERLSSNYLTLTIGAVTNVTSITLTAGDWDVWGNISLQFTNNNGDYAFGAINTTSATLVDPSLMSGYQYGAITTGYWRFTVPYKRISTSASTTTYLVVQAGGTGTVYAGGAIYARRVR